jgi:hypothetical protein
MSIFTALIFIILIHQSQSALIDCIPPSLKPLESIYFVPQTELNRLNNYTVVDIYFGFTPNCQYSEYMVIQTTENLSMLSPVFIDESSLDPIYIFPDLLLGRKKKGQNDTLILESFNMNQIEKFSQSKYGIYNIQTSPDVDLCGIKKSLENTGYWEWIDCVSIAWIDF